MTSVTVAHVVKWIQENPKLLDLDVVFGPKGRKGLVGIVCELAGWRWDPPGEHDEDRIWVMRTGSNQRSAWGERRDALEVASSVLDLGTLFWPDGWPEKYQRRLLRAEQGRRRKEIAELTVGVLEGARR